MFTTHSYGSVIKALAFSFILLFILGSANANEPPKCTAYIFLSPTCPICKVQTLSIRNIGQKFKNDPLKIMLVFQRYCKKKEIKRFISKYKLSEFDWMMDKRMRLAKKFDATTTPEVVLVTNEQKLYQGQITDLYYALGKKRAQITETFLENALNEYLKNEPIKVSKTEPIGCVFR